MIVRLQRSRPHGGPWLLDGGGLEVAFIDPTPQLASKMDGEFGYFHAERLEDGGWWIGEAVSDPATDSTCRRRRG